MVFHFPSFLMGSAMSGSVFLLVEQQISYRNRLTYKWPLAELVETTMREQWQELKLKITDTPTAQVATREVGSLSTYWNQAVSKAKELFDKTK